MCRTTATNPVRLRPTESSANGTDNLRWLTSSAGSLLIIPLLLLPTRLLVGEPSVILSRLSVLTCPSFDRREGTVTDSRTYVLSSELGAVEDPSKGESTSDIAMRSACPALGRGRVKRPTFPLPASCHLGRLFVLLWFFLDVLHLDILSVGERRRGVQSIVHTGHFDSGGRDRG